MRWQLTMRCGHNRNGTAGPGGWGRWVAAAVVACVMSGGLAGSKVYGDRPAPGGDSEAIDAERPGRPSEGGPDGRPGGPRRGIGRPDRPPGPPTDGRGRFRGRPDPELFLSPEEREEVLEFAREHFPEIHERLQEDWDDVPETRSAWRMQRLIWPMIRLMRIARYDPELADLLIAEQRVEMRLSELQRDYLAFPVDSVRVEIKQQMRVLFEERFGLRRQRLEREIRSLQERLEQARQQLQQQEQAKEALIDTELNQLIEDLERRPLRPGVGSPLYELDNGDDLLPERPPARNDSP